MDRIFASPMERTADFDFGKRTAEVFDDMLARSVPFYDEVQCMMLELARSFASDETLIYDLGCSTGTTMLMLARSIKCEKLKLVGIDYSEAMLQKAREKLTGLQSPAQIDLRQGDLNTPLEFEPANVFIMNLTLQFVRPLYRDRLMENIYASTKPGGCLLMFEKVLGEDSLLNRMYIDLYYDFKRRKGYSEMEVSKKREALENVLIPYRISENVELLKRHGFSSVDTFFRWYNFTGFLAIKQET